ncbi:MAG: CPBP family intramembrane metalloprotease, partial [Spirochaetales bacterium]
MSSESNTLRHTPVMTILLHLLPGVLITATGGVAAYLLRDSGVPAYFVFEVSVLVIMAPVMLGIIRWGMRVEAKESVRAMLMRPVQRLKVWEYVVYPLVIVAFAGGVFTLLGDPVNSYFRDLIFPTLPAWADLTDVFTNPDAYAGFWPVVCWATGAVLISIAGPIMEEAYFRGYLLPRIPGSPFVVVAGGVVLFALYHVFSIWMVPVRIIALIPLVFLVWKTRSVT